MVGIYFSGTGNSRYCLETFLSECGTGAKAYSIEQEEAVPQIKNHEVIIFSYPVQYSTLPKILNDFITAHPAIWNNKKVFVIATMGMFSGDGTGVLARLLKRYGANIIGGLHLKMPDSIADKKALAKSLEHNKKLVRKAENKMKASVIAFQNGNPAQDGMGFFCRMAGLFGQRLYFQHKTKQYSDKLKIDTEKCIGCGRCVDLCPMKNIHLSEGHAVSGNQCTMCYRCISRCPAQAITLLGKQVVEQCYVEKYL